jgi:hypothetical protein
MHTHDHADLIKGFMQEQKELFSTSKQGLYVFYDDYARACNPRFAKLLGYASANEWAETDTKGNFPDVFVDPKSQGELVTHFQKAVEQYEASTFAVEWKKKQGGTVKTGVTIVPIMYQGHVLALHFVS